MDKIGVQLVVEGLSSFVGNMDKAKSSLLDMVAPPSLLQDAIGGLWNKMMDFGSWVGDVLAVTIGGLLKDVIQGVIGAIGDLANATIAAGQEFQTLKIRLNGVNLQDMINSGMDYNKAMDESVKLTKDQLEWLQKLAAATPFDNKDISNIYTLARSYGFADETSRQLTQSLTNFTAGMGLSEDEMKRIVVNLGQMQASGKITGRELGDMARGSFVPIGEVMKRVAAMMGKTTDEVDKMRAAGEKIPPELFTQAFMDMVKEEPRFAGAASRMARTFGSATDNVKDLATSFGGLNIVTPILDAIGGHIADFMDQFIKSDDAGQQFTVLGERLLNASISIGNTLVRIINSVLGLMPSANGMGVSLVSSLDTFAIWLQKNEPIIVGGIKSVYDWFMNLGQSDFFKEGGILSKLQELYDQLFTVNDVTGKNGFQDLALAIDAVTKSIIGILEPFLKPLGIQIDKTEPSVNGLVESLNKFSDWINENKELIQNLIRLFIAFQIVQTITNLVFTFVLGLIGLIATVAGVVAGFVILLAFIGIIMASVASLTVILLVLNVAFFFIQWVVGFVIAYILLQFKLMQDTIAEVVKQINLAFQNGDWIGAVTAIFVAIGKAVADSGGNLFRAFGLSGEAAAEGLRNGFFSKWQRLVEDVREAIEGLAEAARDALQIDSPSKVFANIGGNIVAGMAEGITGATGMAVSAMEGMVAAVSMPAMNAPAMTQQYSQAAPTSISSTFQSNQTNNLNIHTSASSEPIIQDFRMLQSMTGT